MNILVVSPHPDDETLGAGGLLLKEKENGNNIYWLIITDMKEEYDFKKKQILNRKKEIENVKKIYGFEKVFNLGLYPCNLGEYEEKEVISKISDVVNEVKPYMVILPNKSDVHSDHKNVFNWCYSCTKIFRFPFIKKIITMEILSETDFANTEESFVPNYFVDISKYIEKKIEIMNIYKSELGEHPFPRSIDGIKALAKIRGISAGTEYAEAFKIIKFIE